MTETPDNPAPVSPAVALRKSLDDLIAESRELRSDMAVSEQLRRRNNAIYLGLLGVLSVFTALLCVLVWQNNKVVDSNRATSAQMADCTTVGGRCYAEGQERLKHAIEDVIRAEIFMAQCARLYPNESGPSYDRKLEACVYGRLAEASKDRPTPHPIPAPTPAPTRGG